MGIAQFDIRKAAIEEMLNNDGVVTRQKYFDGIGSNVQKASNLEMAMNMSGLNFEVEKRPITFATDIIDAETGAVSTIYTPIKDQFATVRKDTNTPLGVVGKNYNLLQNSEAFDFLDTIIGTGQATFETAGIYGDDMAKSFITIKTEGMKILGEEYMPYILLLNSFDGSGAVRAMFTNIRIFCSNCLERALKNAENKISIRHSNSLQAKMDNARNMLTQHGNYLELFNKEAEQLAGITYTRDQFNQLVNQIYEKKDDETPILTLRREAMITQLNTAYDQADLQNFNNTAWKVVQAFADAESHKQVFRQTKNANLANMNTVIKGMELTNYVTDRLLATA